MPHDLAVLAGAGLRLVGVDDEVVRPPVRLLRHEGPFEAGREAGAAAAAQAGVLHLVDDRSRGPSRGSPWCRPRRRAPRALQAPVVQAVEIGEDAVLVGEHRQPSFAATSVAIARRRAAVRAGRRSSRREPAGLPGRRRSSAQLPRRRGRSDRRGRSWPRCRAGDRRRRSAPSAALAASPLGSDLAARIALRGAVGRPRPAAACVDRQRRAGVGRARRRPRRRCRQRRRPVIGIEMPADLRAGLAARRARSVEQRLEALRRQVLVGVGADLHHRRVHAGAEALDLLPGESAVGREVMRLVRGCGAGRRRSGRPRRAACRASCRRPGHAPCGPTGSRWNIV